MELGAGDGKILAHGITRNTADDVDAEFEVLRVRPCCESGQAVGETAGSRDVPAILVQREYELAGLGFGILEIPPLIDHGIVPSVRQELLCEDGGVGFELA